MLGGDTKGDRKNISLASNWKRSRVSAQCVSNFEHVGLRAVQKMVLSLKSTILKYASIEGHVRLLVQVQVETPPYTHILSSSSVIYVS